MIGILKILRFLLIIILASTAITLLIYLFIIFGDRPPKYFPYTPFLKKDVIRWIGISIFGSSFGIFIMSVGILSLKDRKDRLAKKRQRLVNKRQYILQNIFEFRDSDINDSSNSLEISESYEMILWGINCNCRYTAKGFLREHSIGVRMLPHLFSKEIKSNIQPISIDSLVWDYAKVFAKPDAVLQDITKNQIYVIEFKSRILNYKPDNFVDIIKPREFLQTLTAAYVYKQQKEGLTIIPVLRFSNAIILLSDWESVIPKFDFYRQIYFSLESKQDKDSVKSSELANFISLVDFDFIVEPKDEEEARLRGDGRHAMVLQGVPSGK